MLGLQDEMPAAAYGVITRMSGESVASCSYATSSEAIQEDPTSTGGVGEPPVPILSTRRSAPPGNDHPLHVIPAAQPEIRFEIRLSLKSFWDWQIGLRWQLGSF